MNTLADFLLHPPTLLQTLLCPVSPHPYILPPPPPFPLSWQLSKHRHTYPNIPIIFPPYLSKSHQLCILFFLSETSHLRCPSDVLISDLVHPCHSNGSRITIEITNNKFCLDTISNELSHIERTSTNLQYVQEFNVAFAQLSGYHEYTMRMDSSSVRMATLCSLLTQPSERWREFGETCNNCGQVGHKAAYCREKIGVYQNYKSSAQETNYCRTKPARTPTAKSAKKTGWPNDSSYSFSSSSRSRNMHVIMAKLQSLPRGSI